MGFHGLIVFVLVNRRLSEGSVNWPDHYKCSYIILFLSLALNLTAQSVADPGFFWDHKVGLRTYYFAENCMKMKEFGSRGARGVSLAPTLDPPLTVSDFLCPWHWLLIVFNVI